VACYRGEINIERENEVVVIKHFCRKHAASEETVLLQLSDGGKALACTNDFKNVSVMFSAFIYKFLLHAS